MEGWNRGRGTGEVGGGLGRVDGGNRGRRGWGGRICHGEDRGGQNGRRRVKWKEKRNRWMGLKRGMGGGQWQWVESGKRRG